MHRIAKVLVLMSMALPGAMAHAIDTAGRRTLTGVIEDGFMAAGSETTGIGLRDSGGRLTELDSDRIDLAEYVGESVAVTGNYRARSGTESRRRLFVVQKIVILGEEPQPNPLPPSPRPPVNPTPRPPVTPIYSYIFTGSFAQAASGEIFFWTGVEYLLVDNPWIGREFWGLIVQVRGSLFWKVGLDGKTYKAITFHQVALPGYLR